MGASAFAHAIGGGRRLLRPLLELREGVLSSAPARRILCFAWYATAVLMLLSAATVAWPGTPHGLILLIGAAWIATGMVNVAATRGRHIMGPMLIVSGLLAVAGGWG